VEDQAKENDGRGKLIHIRLILEMHQRLKVQAAQEGITVQKWVSRAIREELKRKKMQENWNLLREKKRLEAVSKPKAAAVNEGVSGKE
jgi:hypothetical protein